MGERSGGPETDAQIAGLTLDELEREIWAAQQMAGILKDPARKGC